MEESEKDVESVVDDQRNGVLQTTTRSINKPQTFTERHSTDLVTYLLCSPSDFKEFTRVDILLTDLYNGHSSLETFLQRLIVVLRESNSVKLTL